MLEHVMLVERTSSVRQVPLGRRLQKKTIELEEIFRKTSRLGSSVRFNLTKLIAPLAHGRIFLKVGFDFDGVISKLPYPLRLYMKLVSSNDPISRARLGWVKGIMNKLIERIPTPIDPAAYKLLDNDVYDDVYVISGRRNQRSVEEFLLRHNVRVTGILCRGNEDVGEIEFKLNCCRRLELGIFYEDRPDVARDLLRNGVRVVLW